MPPFNDVDGIRAMGYYDGSDLNYYYFMASNFATSDRWFNPVMTRTPTEPRDILSPLHPRDMSIRLALTAADTALLTAPTIFQELQTAGITWKIYVDPQGSPCIGPALRSCLPADLELCTEFPVGPDDPDPVSSEHCSHISVLHRPGRTEPCRKSLRLSQHQTPVSMSIHQIQIAEPNDIQLGANYVSSLINGLMTSTSWKDSAFILTYDEFGGLYDHVSPQPAVSPDGIKPVDLIPGDICTHNDRADLRLRLHRLPRAPDRCLAVRKEELRLAHRGRY